MLFVYGTLQDGDMLGALLGRPVAMAGLRRALAPGYRAVPYPGRVYPALAASPLEAAPGLLLEGLSERDMAVLDAFEGAEYIRRTITVHVDGTPLPAAAYLPAVPVPATAPAWSLTRWTDTHKALVIGQETETAAALRRRLSAQLPG